MAAHALGRHLALVGFMGAGKSTLGAAVAERLDRRFVDLDTWIEAEEGATVAEIFERHGEARFRTLEQAYAARLLPCGPPSVIALGGGALQSEAIRGLLRAHACTVLVDVDPGEAWGRVAGGDRPLARDREAFLALHAARETQYAASADARATDVDGVLLAAAGVHVERGAIAGLGALVPGTGPVELVVDEDVERLHGEPARAALEGRLTASHGLPAGEAAKDVAVLARLWSSLRCGRDGTLVALGGGCTTDVAGLAAATYMRGIPWAAVPTTLVGQVDAAIGGKTAIDVPGGKNLVGAFHWPTRVVVDPDLLATLPREERRNGLAEVVKTGLLAGAPLWELPEPEQVRACAAFKSGVCLADPYDRGARAQLNLGHTFAHALEAAAGYALPHGQAVALGLLAALELSGDAEALDVVRRVLAPAPVAVDRDAAWAALARDKKAACGRPRLVLLDRPGQPRWGVELPEGDVRRALDALIA